MIKQRIQELETLIALYRRKQALEAELARAEDIGAKLGVTRNALREIEDQIVAREV
jgi:hypothetical protein